MERERRDLNKDLHGNDIQSEYEKYAAYCRSIGIEPRSWYDWYYCTYSGFEESWRLNKNSPPCEDKGVT
jgi:hypothetical protein